MACEVVIDAALMCALHPQKGPCGSRLDKRLSRPNRNVSPGVWNTFFAKMSLAVAKPAQGIVSGTMKQWQPLTLRFLGPRARQTDSKPNPFLDYRMEVTFFSPDGRQYRVAGFFDGDGQGGNAGNVWKVRFTPDEAGKWNYRVSFRRGLEVAVSLDPDAGQPAAFDGEGSYFDIGDREKDAPGFLKWGRLENADGVHYLKFRNGPYWIKGGTDDPENFLAYAGFANTRAGAFGNTHPTWPTGAREIRTGATARARARASSVHSTTWRRRT